MTRRFGLALVLALGLLGYSSGPALADANSDQLVVATVYSPSGTSTATASVATLQGCPTYSGPNTMQELGLSGFVPVTFPANTWALSTILSCLQPKPVALNGQGGVTVLDANGSPETGSGSQLTAADLKPPGQTDFNNPAEGPVVAALGSANRYDRPWRGSAGGTDDDFLDEVVATENDQPTPISIEVFEGPLLTVTAQASQTSVPVGGSVTFNATVTGQTDSGLTYSWNFDGGAPNSSAAAPQATFANAGQYNVTVQVTDAAGGGGVASVPITVGTPPAPATGSQNQNGAGTNKKSKTPTGPRKSKGKNAGGPEGKPKSSQSTKSGKGSGAKTGGTTSQPTSTTSHTSTTNGSTPTSPSHQSTSASPHTSTNTSKTPSTPKPTAAPSTKPATQLPFVGPRVSGLLISDVTPVTAAASPLVHLVSAPLATAPPARQAVRASLLPVFGAVLGVVLLLGLGAARELRTGRDWRALRFGN